MQLKDIAEEMQQRSMAAERDWVFQVLRHRNHPRGASRRNAPSSGRNLRTAQRQPHSRQGRLYRQLDAQGLVRIYPNRGAVVTKLARSGA